MKLKTILLATSLMQLNASAFSQKISLTGKDLSIQQVLKTIESQTDYVVFGDKSILNKLSSISVDVRNVELDEFLKVVFKNNAIGYEIKNKTIVLNSKPTAFKSIEQEFYTFVGSIVDENGKPIPNVNIHVKSTSNRGVSDNLGMFMLNDLEQKSILSFSSVGYQSLEVSYARILNMKVGETIVINNTKIVKQPNNRFQIKLNPLSQEVDEVVVTGVVERKKESFTGATTSFTGDELLAVGNQNPIQSLKTLDPSFLVIENTSFGSNPNRLADIEIRGRSSFTSEDLQNTYGTNPNLPLFILDGFESDLRTITDISIHRIARITLLKDAASTALYGSRASNGVVVVETKQPKAGKIEVTYSSDLIVNAPFLNDYNLMNAAEKLEFERLSGQFSNAGFLNSNMLTEADYYSRLADVKKGVDTYWLSEPLRTGFTHGHNLNLSGGNEDLRFNAGLSYKNDQGVMIGSNRDTWRGSLSMTYRKNKFNINNQLFVNGYTAKESPYGNFSDFSRAVPYYRKRNENGEVMRYLNFFQDPNLAQGYGVDSVANPLYTALVNNRDNTNSLGFTNNLQANYDFTSNLRLTTSLSVTKGNTENVVFRPAENPEYDQRISEEKGLYTNTRTNNSSYQGSLMLTYARVFNDIHSLTSNIRAEIQENKYNTVGFGATGFATLSNGNPNLASGYIPYGRPNGTVFISRRNNILGSVNYMLNAKYLADFSYRYDGSTAFGSSQRYSPFWSFGLGWNLHNEEVLAKSEIFDLLKLRGSIGYTGNQQFGQLLSVNVYQQFAGRNIFGEMADLTGLGNPNLEWQRTQNVSVGADFGLFKNRLNGFVNLYRNHSSPLVVPIVQAPSSGVNTYNENLGSLTYKGIEARVNYGIIYKPEDRLVWNFMLTLANNKGEYKGFDGKLNNLNEQQKISNSYTRYYDGNSPEGIWAVRSAGIDPLTGKELFYAKDGTLTFNYNVNDEVLLGSTRPKLEGVVGTNVSIKSFSAGVFLRYSIQSQHLNTALYNKVENLSPSQIRMYNFDKRALYDRWQNPGDIAAFKAITDHSYTPISSRFVQNQTFLAGESFNISYRFIDNVWLKKSGLKSLMISGYTNDIFRWSTIRNERGIDYPFASSFSLNINASF